ncbi:MAG: P-loop NTPase [Gemmatimonadetes bacterium]|nr:P-loop NTPase [Gemmatimonadota bacterium]NIO32623.1 P-loop NTPase [Gemmatimonadota bacterium]
MADERELVRQVAMALRSIVDPGTGKDIVASGSVTELKAGGPGEVGFVLLTGPDDPAGLVEQARAAAESVEGVEMVRMEVRGGGSRGGRKLPVMGQAAGGGREPASTPAPPTPDTVPGVARVVAVSSGKGGVGKSTVAANLAVALAKRGARVGLMDADVYGPNIPIMFGVYSRPGITADEKVVPIESHGVKLMSIGFLLDEDTPAIWRGPIVMGIIRQFLRQVEWGELDYLIVDMPPGTGDAQLSLVQLARVDGALLVTTPQGVATADVLKGIKMFERVEVPVLGLVENMSGFICPHCGERTDVFGRGGGRKLAASAGVAFLGEIPLGAAVVEAGDSGRPTVASAPDSPEAQAFLTLADNLAGVLQEAETKGS